MPKTPTAIGLLLALRRQLLPDPLRCPEPAVDVVAGSSTDRAVRADGDLVGSRWETQLVDPESLMAVPRTLLDELLADVEVPVGLMPGSGLNLTRDWWTVSFEPFGLTRTDYGVDAALIGLTYDVRDALAERLAEPLPDDNPLLLMRLWLADETQQLGRLLEGSSRLIGWDYDEMCAAERAR